MCGSYLWFHIESTLIRSMEQSTLAPNFQLAEKIAIQCLFNGNDLIQTAISEPKIQQFMGGQSRVYRLSSTIRQYCEFLEENCDVIELVRPWLLRVAQEPLEHDGIIAATAHRLAWDFAHRLWLNIQIAVNEGRLTARKKPCNTEGGFCRFDDADLDDHWQAIRDRLRSKQPINNFLFAPIIQIESQKARAEYEKSEQTAMVNTGSTSAEPARHSPEQAPSKMPAWKRLKITPQTGGNDIAKIDGSEYRLRAGAADLLTTLQNAEGKMVLGTTLKDKCGPRADRIYKSLPKDIQAIIDQPGNKRQGYRML